MTKEGRHVKVAVDGEKEWINILSSAFSKSVFQFTAPNKSMFAEEGAKIDIEFIEYEEKLISLNDVGNDPYEHPFLYLYIVNGVGKNNSEELKDRIDIWIEKKIMLAATYLVIFIQDDKSSKNSNYVFEGKNVKIIRYNNKSKQYQANYLEEIRQAIIDGIATDFNSNESEAQIRIQNSRNPINTAKLKIWRNLLLFSFGFVEAARVGFIENYTNMITNTEFQYTFSDLLKIQIDLKQIQGYPRPPEANDIYSILSFALHGVLAVSYKALDFEAISTFFFKQFSLLRSKCDPNNEKKAKEWGKNNIDTICKLPSFYSKTEMASHLLFKRFELSTQLLDDIREVDKLYQSIRNDLQQSFPKITATMDSLYVIYLNNHNSETRFKDINFTASTKIIAWPIVYSAALIMFNYTMNAKDYESAFELSKLLLSDQCHITNKKEIFDRIINTEQRFVYNSLFRINMNFESEAFKSEMPAQHPFTVVAKFTGPSWFPFLHFDEAKLHIKINDTVRKHCSSKEKIGHNKIPFQITVSADGTWHFTKFRLIFSGIELAWNVRTNYRLKISAQEKIPIHVSLPRIIAVSQELTMSMTMDFTRINVEYIKQQIFFDDPKIAIIPKQEGAIDSMKFEIDEKGFITYENLDASLKLITIPITINCKELTSTHTKLIVDSTINDIKQSDSFKANMDFPFKLHVRMRTDEFIHLVLKNSCDIPLIVSNDSLNDTVEPEQELFFMHPANQPEFSITVSDGANEKITKTWNINDDIFYPKIDVKYDNQDIYTVGVAFNIELTLSQCNYEFVPNENFVIVGMTHKNNFPGGVLKLSLIPIKTGCIEIPNITINGVLYILHPKFLVTTAASTLSLSPFIPEIE